MTGILLVAHGSRENNTEQTMERIRAQVQELLGLPLVHAAYMEFRKTNIAGGLQGLIDEGADEIKVIPYFLFEGVHIKQDIPQEIAAFAAEHPEVSITLGGTLGADRRLAEVCADRVRELL